MKIFSPEELSKVTNGSWYLDKKPQEGVGLLIQDTRLLMPGMGFVALKEGRVDGHVFLEQALDAGASMALVSTPCSNIELPQLIVPDTLIAWQMLAAESRKAFNGPVIAVTGSHGKTSTKDLLKLLLGIEHTHANRLNYNGQLGVPYTLMQLDEGKHQQAVIEAGMNMPGEMDKLEQMIKPDAGMVTLISGCHLKYLKTVDRIAFEKAQLLRGLKSEDLTLLHVSCMDFDPFKNLNANKWIIGEIGDERLKDHKQTIKYSIEYEKGAKQWIKIQKGEAELDVFSAPLMTDGMVCNTVMAISMAQAYGVSHRLIQERLSLWEPSDRRGEIKQLDGQVFYVDCYGSASPLSLFDSIKFFQRIFDSVAKRLYVIGPIAELGENSDSIHFDTGRSLSLKSHDSAIMIGQEVKPMIEGLLQNGTKKEQIIYFDETLDALNIMKDFAGAIYLKGGHRYDLARLVPLTAELKRLEEVLPC